MILYMGTKIFLTIITGLNLLFYSEFQQKDAFDTLSAHFKSSGSKEIAAYFSPLIEMNILSDENEYSKAQAELILRDFFLRNKPVSVKIIHRLSSNPNFRFAVLSYQTDKDRFRVSVSMSREGERFLIKVIRIEYDKE